MLTNKKPLSRSEAGAGGVVSDTLLTYVRAREFALWMWRKAKSGLALLGAFALAVFGVAVGYGGAMVARQPDSVLMQIARETHNANPRSVADERDVYLVMLGVGVALTMWGLYYVRAWCRPVQKKESV
jgi:hypothetical protein